MSDFAERLEIELKRRYDLCEDFAATPSSILLAVLNAVAEARRDHADRTAQPGQMPSCHVCGTTMNGVCPKCEATTGAEPVSREREQAIEECAKDKDR